MRSDIAYPSDMNNNLNPFKKFSSTKQYNKKSVKKKS